MGNYIAAYIDVTEAWLQVDASASGFRSEGGRSGLHGAKDSQQEEEVTEVTGSRSGADRNLQRNAVDCGFTVSLL